MSRLSQDATSMSLSTVEQQRSWPRPDVTWQMCWPAKEQCVSFFFSAKNKAVWAKVLYSFFFCLCPWISISVMAIWAVDTRHEPNNSKNSSCCYSRPRALGEEAISLGGCRGHLLCHANRGLCPEDHPRLQGRTACHVFSSTFVLFGWYVTNTQGQ